MEWTDTHIIELIKQQGSGSGNSHGDMSPINIARELYESMIADSVAYNLQSSSQQARDFFDIIKPCLSDDMSYSPNISKKTYSLLDSAMGVNGFLEWAEVGCSDYTDSVYLYLTLAGGARLNYSQTSGMQGLIGFYPSDSIWTGEQEILRSTLRKSLPEEAYSGGELVHEYNNPVFPSLQDFSGVTDTTGKINIHLTPKSYLIDLGQTVGSIDMDSYVGSITTTLYKVSFTFNTTAASALPDSANVIAFRRPVYHVSKFN